MIFRSFPLLCWILLPTLAMGQLGTGATNDPARVISPSQGLAPLHSYSLSDIEAINEATGALGLHLGVGALPPGPGGFSTGFTLSYSNKYWETLATEIDAAHHNFYYGLIHAPRGGWNLSAGYSIETVGVVARAGDPCLQGATDNLFQLRLYTPDGSSHQLYHLGSLRLEGCSYGTYPTSDQTTSSANTQTWYTTDGSFLRVTFPSAANKCLPNGCGGWTIWLPDGGRVTMDAAGTQRIYDVHGNWVELATTAGGGGVVTQLKDQYGRTVKATDVTTAGVRTTTITRPAATVDATDPSQPSQAPDLQWVIHWVPLCNVTTGVCGGSQAYIANAVPSTVYGTFQGFDVVSSITLPNGQSYSFTYAAKFGELSHMVLPTGATVDYQYELDTAASAPWAWGVLVNPLKTKTVQYLNEDDNAGTPVAIVTAYQCGSVAAGTVSGCAVTGPDGSVRTNTAYLTDYHWGSGSNLSGFIQQTTESPYAEVLERVWSYNPLPSGSDFDANPFVSMTVRTDGAVGTGRSAVTVHKVDKNGNDTETTDYDWVAWTAVHDPSNVPTAASGTQLRKVTRTYYYATRDSQSTTTDAVKDANIYYIATTGLPRNAVTRTETWGPSVAEAVTARSLAVKSGCAPNSPFVVSNEAHWSAASGSTTPPANLDSSNASVWNFSADCSGNITSVQDPLPHTTSYVYGNVTGCSTCTGLYITQISRGSGTTAEQYNFDYDFATGLVAWAQDPNGVGVSTYYDQYGRVKATLEGGTRGSGLRKTQSYFDDTNRFVATATDLDTFGDQHVVKVTRFDQLGRERLTQTFDTNPGSIQSLASNTAGIKVQTRYGFFSGGSYKQVSNPYTTFPSSGAVAAEYPGWTTAATDTLGRVCAVDTTAGAAAPSSPSCSGVSGSNGRTTVRYDFTADGSRTIQQDPMSVTHHSYKDALGRLTGVVEDPSGKSYVTRYAYNSLGGLLNVWQSGACTSSPLSSCGSLVSRTFSYDTRGLLTSAQNPESGTIGYSYYANGDLYRKTDGRNSVVTYSYDDVNRVIQKDYTAVGALATTSVSYEYSDLSGRLGCSGTAYQKTRLTAVTAGAFKTYLDCYDALGRPAKSRQVMSDTDKYDFAYEYSAGGMRKSITYPSGRKVSTTYDDAARPTSLKAAAATTYLSSIQYAPHGGAISLQWPTLEATPRVVTITQGYNSRHQMESVTAMAGATSVWSATNSYTSSAGCNSTTTCNNGNVMGNTVTASLAGDPQRSQSFTYDGLNRLKTAGEAAVTSGAAWQQTYVYDPFGNMAQLVGGWMPSGTRTPQVATDTVTEVQNLYTGNRLPAASLVYDSAGNVLTEVKTGATYRYDVENRVVCAAANSESCDGATKPAVYEYDGNGRRVRKTITTGSDSTATTYVYDAEGQLVAEYSGSPSGATGTQWVVADQLGSARFLLNGTGTDGQAFDYLPFGEDLTQGVNARGLKFVAGTGLKAQTLEAVRFTGKERDAETGLDYFGARYFSGAQGRFTSPDPTFMTRQRISDPQQWNLYTYTRNNPLKYIDPDGRELRLAIYSGSLPQNVATAAANHMAAKLSGSGVKNVTYDLRSGSPSTLETIRYQMLPNPHSVLVELRPSRSGDPALKPNESGHNYGGQAVVDTSAVTAKTGDPSQQAIGIGNLAVHEVGHEVTPFHPAGDQIMDTNASDPNMLRPDLQFSPGMQKGLQDRYNRPGEVEQTQQTPQSPAPPPPPSCSIPGTGGACRN